MQEQLLGASHDNKYMYMLTTFILYFNNATYVLFLVLYENNQFGADTFMSGRCYQNMATVQISHAQVLQINYYKKTNYYCKKTCGSKINLKHTVFYKHIAILCINITQQPPTKVMEQHFPFLHLHKKYNSFKIIYQALNKVNQ